MFCRSTSKLEEGVTERGRGTDSWHDDFKLQVACHFGSCIARQFAGICLCLASLPVSHLSSPFSSPILCLCSCLPVLISCCAPFFLVSSERVFCFSFSLSLLLRFTFARCFSPTDCDPYVELQPQFQLSSNPQHEIS